MAILPVDRDPEYMKKTWGTTNLITDYWSLPKQTEYLKKENIFEGEKIHDLKKQSELHEQIRNDEDYDDWEYGTEPIYGKKLL